MDELKQILDPKEYLQKARQIFEEREQEFQMREMQFTKKKASLQNLLDEIAERRTILEKEQAEMEQQRIFAAEEQKTNQEKQQQISELEMQYNLELEKVRNEKMKLERTISDYEYKIQSLGQENLSNMEQDVPSINLDEYIHISEHEQMVCNLTS